MNIKKNDRIRLEITGMTSEGSGVGHVDGMAVFAANTAVGDVITAHIIKAKKNYAVARVHQVVTPSPDRIKPDCDVFNQCGGCSYRHLNYEAELKIKYQRVADAFERIGGLNVNLQPIIGAQTTDGYRNKAQYPVGTERGKVKIGFFAPRSHRIVDCRNCRLQPDSFTAALRAFDKWIKDEKISLYDELTHKGLLRHIYLREAMATGEVMACVVVNGENIPKPEILVGYLLKEVPFLKSLVLNVNRERTNVIMGDKCRTLWGDSYITDELCGCKFRISPLSFYQVNRAQAEVLYKKAAEYADLQGKETLLDLYCGTGTIGLTMADKVKNLIGVEVVPQAIEDAKVNAELNGIENARFICDDASGAAARLEEEGVRPDVILLDPPRKGCDEALVETVSRMSPERIVYVSCDPATLARDCARFREHGYTVREATPVDLFPRTSHVETVALIQKQIM